MPQQRPRHTKNLQSVEQVVLHILVIQAAFDGCWSTEGFFNWIEERGL